MYVKEIDKEQTGNESSQEEEPAQTTADLLIS